MTSYCFGRSGLPNIGITRLYTAAIVIATHRLRTATCRLTPRSNTRIIFTQRNARQGQCHRLQRTNNALVRPPPRKRISQTCLVLKPIQTRMHSTSALLPSTTKAYRREFAQRSTHTLWRRSRSRIRCHPRCAESPSIELLWPTTRRQYPNGPANRCQEQRCQSIQWWSSATAIVSSVREPHVKW